MTINKIYTDLKSISKNTKLVDTMFLGKYKFSPYRACQHACKYCDGRAEKYYVEGDFEKDIVIRKNIPDLLKVQLPKLREKGLFSIGSGTSDAYQPVEREEKIMEKCAKIFAEYEFGVGILTKSALILRDIDLWEQVHKKSGFCLMVSLTFLDDDIRKIFEPNASSVEARLKTLTEFKKRGMYIGVLAMPFIPYISDTEENITNLVKKLKEIGVDFIVPGGLTLRPGIQKDIFMEVLTEHFPELREKFELLYRKNLRSGAPLYSYRQKLYKSAEKIITNFQIPMEPPHHLYKDAFPLYDEIYILLCHMMSLYSRKGVDISPLKEEFKKYRDWLLAEKKYFNRRQNLDHRFIEENLLNLINNKQLKNLIENEKLANFMEEIIIERKTFDYIELKNYES